MVIAIFYIVYAAITGRFTLFLWISLALMALEILALVLNNWRCPLTNIAEKYTKDRSPNFDIYLPMWIAEHNKIIFGIIFAVGFILLVLRLAFLNQ